MRIQYFKLGGKHMCKGVTLPNIRRWVGYREQLIKKLYYLLGDNITLLKVL